MYATINNNIDSILLAIGFVLSTPFFAMMFGVKPRSDNAEVAILLLVCLGVGAIGMASIVLYVREAVMTWTPDTVSWRFVTEPLVTLAFSALTGLGLGRLQRLRRPARRSRPT